MEYRTEDAMSTEMRTNRVFMDQPGRISDTEGMNISIHFDLVETQNFVNGVPGPEFAFGNLRYPEKHKSQVLSRLHARTRVNLQGGGIQTTVFLNSLTSFTVMCAIAESALTALAKSA
jgi:hypothetical protein